MARMSHKLIGPRVGSPKNKLAYQFLCDHERDGSEFSVNDIVLATGWGIDTSKQYISTRLKPFLTLTTSGYLAKDTCKYDEEEFCRLVSQSVVVARNPLKPQVSVKVDRLVRKAQESALAAVQHYNNPVARLRSGNYLSLMIIAFTALFHAILDQDGVSYIELDNNGNTKLNGGKPLLWDCIGCSNHYRNLPANKAKQKFLDCLHENLRLLLPLRHDFEHRDNDLIDELIAGHCQAMLRNFERLLKSEFGRYYSLNHSLALALQFSTERSEEVIDSLRDLHAAEYDELKQYINDFHAGLSEEIAGDQSFSVRVWLVPKPAKHANASDISIEYVPIDMNDPDQTAALEKAIVAIRQVVRRVANADLMKPKKVVEYVRRKIGRSFTQHHHTLCWKHYQVRPPSGADDRTATKSEYCIYDAMNEQYGYTQAWVDFLIAELNDLVKYEEICHPGPKSTLVKASSVDTRLLRFAKSKAAA